MVQELSETYSAVVAGRPPSRPDLPFPFGNFVRWQRRRLQGAQVEQHFDFWRQQLNSKGFEHLAPDFARPANNSYSGAKLTTILPDKLVESLLALSRQEYVSPFTVLLSGFKCLLHYYSGDEEIAIGTCAANRHLEEVEGLVGRFGNNTLLRTSLAGDPTFSDLFRRVQKVTLEALSHLEVPFGMLLETVAPADSPSRVRPFQMMFILQDAPKENWHLSGLSAQWTPLEMPTSKFDLIVWLKPEPKLEITLEYATQVFAPATISKVLQDYQAILETIVREPDRRINDAPATVRREPVVTVKAVSQ
jgi:non-ribosomal peptide synthetase component F